MQLPDHPPHPDPFELRCRTRREVAEMLSLVEAGSGYTLRAGQVREQYLDALHSASALEAVREAAGELAGFLRYERYCRAELV